MHVVKINKLYCFFYFLIDHNLILFNLQIILTKYQFENTTYQ